MIMNKALLLVILFLLAGCGYVSQDNTYSTSDIFVAPVVNEIKITQEGRLYRDYKAYPRLIENRLTSALVRRFNIHGGLRAQAAGDNQLKLVCAVTKYEKNVLQYADEDKGGVRDDIKQQRLNLCVSCKLYDIDGKIIKEREVSGTVDYYLTGPQAKSEDSAWVELIEDTSRRISEFVLENW